MTSARDPASEPVTRRPRRSFLTVGVVIVLCVLMVVTWLQRRVGGEVRSAIVLEIRVDASSVTDDERLDRYLIGDGAVTREAATAALCVNSELFGGDVTLTPVISVSNSRRLLRVAELVDDGDADPDVAARVEASILRAGSTALSDLVTLTDLPPDRVGAYLADTTAEPRSDAGERYVVFAALTKMNEVGVFIVDRSTIDLARLDPMTRIRHDTYVPTEGAWSRLDISPEDCR